MDIAQAGGGAAAELPDVEQLSKLVTEDDTLVEARWKQQPLHDLDATIHEYRSHIKQLEAQLGHQPGTAWPEHAAPATHNGNDAPNDEVYGSVDDLDPTEWQVPPHCIPIHANVTTYDWKQLYSHTQFDVIMMDPPWQLATANPTRGVALGYSQLTDNDITALPVNKLQSDGFLFVWVINAKYRYTLELFDKWGYRLVDEIVWVKMTCNRRLAKSHGYYLQHAKEVCLVGQRGAVPPRLKGGVGSDVIFSERRGQSQKPEEIYELIEELVPGGKYLEIFARKNNLRNFWVSVGNEVTGTGLPEDDAAAVQGNLGIPGAVYGAASKRDGAPGAMYGRSGK